jgi:hypothetical protein
LNGGDGRTGVGALRKRGEDCKLEVRCWCLWKGCVMCGIFYSWTRLKRVKLGENRNNDWKCVFRRSVSVGEIMNVKGYNGIFREFLQVFFEVQTTGKFRNFLSLIPIKVHKFFPPANSRNFASFFSIYKLQLNVKEIET